MLVLFLALSFLCLERVNKFLAILVKAFASCDPGLSFYPTYLVIYTTNPHHWSPRPVPGVYQDNGKSKSGRVSLVWRESFSWSQTDSLCLPFHLAKIRSAYLFNYSTDYAFQNLLWLRLLHPLSFPGDIPKSGDTPLWSAFTSYGSYLSSGCSLFYLFSCGLSFLRIVFFLPIGSNYEQHSTNWHLPRTSLCDVS